MKAQRIAIIKFSLAAITLGLSGFWTINASQTFDLMAYGILGVVVVAAGFMIYSGLQALGDAKTGLNPEDERSKKNNQKAAAIAFQFSFFMWLSGLFFLDEILIDSIIKVKFVIAFGMMSMGMVFLFTRLYLTRVGTYEDQD